MPAPLSETGVEAQLTSRGIPPKQIGEKHIIGGVSFKNLDPRDPNAQRLIALTLLAMNGIKDEHMPTLSVIQCGFLRRLAVERDTDNGIKIYAYFRFTIDECPAGVRMAKSAELEVMKISSSVPGTYIKSVEAIHGGKPWSEATAPVAVQGLLSKVLSA
jgi:hypothetical protein